MTTYTARWVFPVSQPPLERGTVTVEGERIVAVEPHGSRTPDVDLGNVAIIPGLVNAHTHLDLSGARGLIPPTDPEHFTDWLMGVIAYRRTRTPEQVQGDIRDGLAECLKFGTTLVGDITSDGSSYRELHTAEMRSNLFREFIGLDSAIANERIEQHFVFREEHPANDRCRWNASPHAPYSINHDVAWHQLRFAGAAIHLAESPAELELLKSQSGPFRRFLESLGVWIDGALNLRLEEFVTTVVARTRNVNRLYIHCNYLLPETLFDASQTIVFCPRTHAAFQHPRHPFPQFLKRGVRVALGTDSLASNPDLDLLAEARFTFRHFPEVGGETVLKMATLNGAEALGWADTCGSLDAGKSADFVTVPLPDAEGADPYEMLLGTTAIDGPRRTLFRGEWRIC